jgi:hypothetical protein
MLVDVKLREIRMIKKRTHQCVNSAQSCEMFICEGFTESVSPFGSIIMIKHRRSHDFETFSRVKIFLSKKELMMQNTKSFELIE